SPVRTNFAHANAVPRALRALGLTHTRLHAHAFAGDDALVHFAIARHDARFVESLDGDAARGYAHAAMVLAIGQNLDRARGHAVGVADRQEISGLTVGDDFRQTARLRGDDRHFARHRFERGHAERLGVGWKNEQIARADDLFEIVDVAEEVNAIGEVPLATDRFGERAIRTVADHRQATGNHARHFLEDVDHIHHAFHGTEVRHVTHQSIAGRAEEMTCLTARAMK